MMEKFGKHFEMSAIAKNMDTYISFTGSFKVPYFCVTENKMKEKTAKVIFKDSLAFLSCSLDTIAKTLTNDDCKILGSHFKGEQFKIIRQKGIYPYSYVNTTDVFNDTCLPPIEAFHNDLNNEKCKQGDYERACYAWEAFNCQNFGDYHDLYLKSDVMILADVFEKFRATTLTSYGLDPVRYFTTPGLSWDACLKMTGIKLQLFAEKDADMFLFIENGIRGGFSGITTRLVVANNPMCPGYDATKPTTWVMYDDANNLYGHAMSRSLPTGGFRWHPEPESVDAFAYNGDTAIGAIMEVDLHYPKHLHDAHNDFPCAPERRAVNVSELSPLSNIMDPKYNDKSPKLLQTLHDKKNYVVHYSVLQEYIKQGLIITKVHRVLEFEQSPWLAKYIDYNTQMRNAKNATEFDKNFYKLMNNAFYGKTMENVRNRSDVRFFTSKTRKYMMKAQKCRNSPQYIGEHEFNDDLAAIHMQKTTCKLDKPQYLGMCILDLSKQHMYDYWYNTIKAKYGEKAKLLMTDTDSLCFSVETEDIYRDRLDYIEQLDNSKYPVGHFLHNSNTAIGKFKDEMAGKVIHKFAGTRAKCYAYKMADSYEAYRCKGVKSSFVKQNIKFEDYANCITSFNTVIKEAKFNNLQKHHHDIYATVITKKAITCNDSKRYICDDNINTRAHGHYAHK